MQAVVRCAEKQSKTVTNRKTYDEQGKKKVKENRGGFRKKMSQRQQGRTNSEER